MPPRLSLFSAIHKWRCTLAQPIACLTTTSRTSALKDIPTPSKALLGLGDEPNPTDTLHALFKESEERRMSRARARRDNNLKQVNQSAVAEAYMRQMPRGWRAGDVYSPRDLSPEELAKWRKNYKRREDVLDILGINPLEQYKNMSMISEHVTPMGRIKHSRDTGLRPANQRKMAKAIRRAIGMGLHPSIHRHPEILRMSEEYQRHSARAPTKMRF